MIAALWDELKVWRRLRFGPLSLYFGFRRAVRVTPGSDRKRDALVADSRERGIDSEKTSIQMPLHAQAASAGTAVIVGVGPGFGYALAKLLAESGFDLALISRDADRLIPLCHDLRGNGVVVESYGADVTHERDVKAVFGRVLTRHGVPALVVYSLQEFGPGGALDISPSAFESAWRHNCLGAFLVSQIVGKAMRDAGRGSIFLVGSTSSLLGREGHLNLAVGKFGQRALAQVLARELWSHGVHVAHLLIDADIAENPKDDHGKPQAYPEDIAFSILSLHRQPRSAWTSELDLRPWNESFWEHC